MQGDAGLPKSVEPWQPYEAAPSESYLVRMPVPFYRQRWSVMHYNPFCWPLWNGCTAGEAATSVLILAQMAVTCIWWVADPRFRVNVTATGAPGPHLMPTICN